MSDTNELRTKAIAMVDALHDLGGGAMMGSDISASMMWAASEIERLRTELSNAECQIEQLQLAEQDGYAQSSTYSESANK